MVPAPPSVSSASELRAERERVERELDRLRREEEDLQDQVRRAREQVHYYDGLLQRLKSEWSRAPSADEIVRRMG